jgi:SpoVK/Ycf46/Vps4 family AAA+-type ATPase
MTIPVQPTPSAKPREKWKAILLALFLGSFGLHQFYLGNKRLGYIYLFLFWTGIPGVFAIISAIGLLFTSQKTFDKKYNQKLCIDCGNPIETYIESDDYCLGCVTSNANKIIEKINTESKNKSSNQSDKEKKKHLSKENNEDGTLEDVLQELNSLVGLKEVKEEINTLINFIRIQKEREEEGLKTSSVSYHMVFTGNPGTGKTTVARIVSKVYAHLGILDVGELIETDRAGLIAEYEGQTAAKVDEVIDEALDSVLFIDEAYSLNSGSNEIFGKEAVATLLKRMEDDRDRLVVVLAGYTNEMKTFLNTNPGFNSRFNRYINFADYTPEDLLAIFEINCKKSDYVLDEAAKNKALELFTDAYAQKDESFGNARFARNMFECTIEKHSNRIAQEKDISKSMLTTIMEHDVSLN